MIDDCIWCESLSHTYDECPDRREVAARRLNESRDQAARAAIAAPVAQAGEGR